MLFCLQQHQTVRSVIYTYIGIQKNMFTEHLSHYQEEI